MNEAVDCFPLMHGLNMCFPTPQLLLLDDLSWVSFLITAGVCPCDEMHGTLLATRMRGNEVHTSAWIQIKSVSKTCDTGTPDACR